MLILYPKYALDLECHAAKWAGISLVYILLFALEQPD